MSAAEIRCVAPVSQLPVWEATMAAGAIWRSGHRNHLLARSLVETMSAFQFLTCRNWPRRLAMRSEYMIVTGRPDG